MSYKTFHIDFKELKLNISEIESVLGYNEEDEHLFVTSLIEEILVESQGISNIKAQYEIFDDIQFDNISKSVIIDKVSFQVKKIVFNQLNKSDSVALFLCTAGEEIGIRCQKAMKERDFLRGYIYDLVGSEIVEAATDILQDELEGSLVGSGRKITNRYSPGYCGWDVAEQHKLFGFFPDNYAGIRLTTSALMDPVKSVSGIIGIGFNVKSNPYTCRMCGMKDCVFRKVKESRSGTINPS
jgi:hypothetical protein